MTGEIPSVVRWDQGRAVVEELLTVGQLTPVQPSRELAMQYLSTARTRLGVVELIEGEDPAGAFILSYDAARLALASVLVNQGLRPRGDGAHAVLLDVVLAQTEPPKQPELREFSWMRRLRNDTQYPDIDRRSATSDDLAQAVVAANAIVDRAELLVAHMPPF